MATRTRDFFFDAGLLVRGAVRRKLDAMQFLGDISRWSESKSLLASTFFVYDANESAFEEFQSLSERLNG